MTECGVSALKEFDPLSLTHYYDRLSNDLGIELFVQRDDLMPLPFGGNKWVKLAGILHAGARNTVYVTNGGVDSNHCRAMASWAALNGRECHFVLHGGAEDLGSPSLGVLDRLGASYEVVPANDIAFSIEEKRRSEEAAGKAVVVIPGGGHSLEGFRSFSRHASKIIETVNPDSVVFASGTGGTQAGIIHAVESLGLEATRVTGISVARPAERGRKVISDALIELGVGGAPIDFREEYRGAGYGKKTAGSLAAMEFASERGLLLDPIYTGKAFHGLIEMVKSGEIISGAKVLFWHTGGSFLATHARPSR